MELSAEMVHFDHSLSFHSGHFSLSTLVLKEEEQHYRAASASAGEWREGLQLPSCQPGVK